MKKNGFRNSSVKSEASDEFLINKKNVDMRVIKDIKKDSKPNKE